MSDKTDTTPEITITITLETARVVRSYLPKRVNRSRKRSLSELKRLDAFLSALSQAERQNERQLYDLVIAGGAQDPGVNRR